MTIVYDGMSSLRQTYRNAGKQVLIMTMANDDKLGNVVILPEIKSDYGL